MPVKYFAFVLLSISFVFALTACSSHPSKPLSSAQSETELLTVSEKTFRPANNHASDQTIQLPLINEIKTISPGETIISSIHAEEVDGIELDHNITQTIYYHGVKNIFTLEKGKYLLTNENNSGQFYTKANSVLQTVQEASVRVSRFGGLFIPNDGSNPRIFYEHKRKLLVFIHNAVVYKKIRIQHLAESSLKKQLLYQGKVGNVIKIQYRELKNNYARPAFNLDLSFDISNDKEIGFKGAIFEILRASNTQLKYLVKKQFPEN